MTDTSIFAGLLNIMNNTEQNILKMPSTNRWFNFVELAGTVWRKRRYALRPPKPSPQAMNRAEKWRRQQNEQTVLTII